MCHLDPDERPKACSLLHGLARSKQLSDWQSISKDWMERMPVGLKRLMFPYVDARDVICAHPSGAVVALPVEQEWGEEFNVVRRFCERHPDILADIANDANVMSTGTFRATWPEVPVDKLKAFMYHLAKTWVE
jgi:hypothetical protein